MCQKRGPAGGVRLRGMPGVGTPGLGACRDPLDFGAAHQRAACQWDEVGLAPGGRPVVGGARQAQGPSSIGPGQQFRFSRRSSLRQRSGRVAPDSGPSATPEFSTEPWPSRASRSSVADVNAICLGFAAVREETDRTITQASDDRSLCRGRRANLHLSAFSHNGPARRDRTGNADDRADPRQGGGAAERNSHHGTTNRQAKRSGCFLPGTTIRSTRHPAAAVRTGSHRSSVGPVMSRTARTALATAFGTDRSCGPGSLPR